MAAHEARQVLWWPFTQHGSVAGDDTVTVIDGRAGESFAVWQPQQGAAGGWRGSEMQLQYDACASWWTQVRDLGSDSCPHPLECFSCCQKAIHLSPPDTPHHPTQTKHTYKHYTPTGRRRRA